MAASPTEDAGFVFTLSDHEDFSHSEEEIQPKKKRKLQHLGARPTTTVSEDSASEEGEDDGAFDPDFEFDLGANVTTGILEDFDGWGANDKSRESTSKEKKGTDLDDIVARRAAKKAIKSTTAKAKIEDESLLENSGFEDEDEQEGEGFLNFEDDELLAADVFGAGASSEEEKEEPASEANAEDQSHDRDDEDEDEDEDAESVASPVAHPDDVASDNDSDTSISDAEETAKRAAFFAPESKSQPKAAKSNAFTSLNLSRPILKALTTLAFTTPTPIQVRTIPQALAGHDVVGSAVTGSGKTAAFLLPILERLLYRPRRIPTTRVSILVPTRELAVQCHAVAGQLAKYTDITFALVVGGFSLREQEGILKKRPDVVIATPGRFIDHMRNSASFAVENLEILVLDEADRMLDDGFADELDEILKTIPKSRQTMLFSATMTDKVDKLVRVGMNRPVRVSVDKKKATTGGLVQEFVRLRPGREAMRLASLVILCTKVFKERTIVFFRQKKEAHRVRVVFALLGIKAGELHGSMTQEQRIKAVEAFRDGSTSHLLATDLASRGLDIKNVATVLNYEAPQSHEIYVHRVGRTARAGKEGRACTIAAESDRKVVKAAVKSGRTQGAKIVSRVMEQKEIETMHKTVTDLESEVEEILVEEKEEKQLAQVETQLKRGENLVEHRDEIMARPRRTWFESEKEKIIAKVKGREELNGLNMNDGGASGRKGKKLSNKDKKRLDLKKERVELGGGWRKGKGSEGAVKADKKDSSKKREKVRSKAKRTGGGGGGGKVGRSAGGKKYKRR